MHYRYRKRNQYADKVESERENDNICKTVFYLQRNMQKRPMMATKTQHPKMVANTTNSDISGKKEEKKTKKRG